MSDRRHIVGAVDFFEKNRWAKDAFGAVHTGGGVVLSTFGAGALVKPLTELEASEGLLPDWAKGGFTPRAGAVVINKPDYVVIVHASAGVRPEVLEAPAATLVAGGRRIDGNGYKTGDGVNKTFSFGYDEPTKIEWIDSKGNKGAASDAKQALFLGGAEQTQTQQVKGDIMSNYIIGSDLIGAAPKLARRGKPAKSLAGAVASAVAAAANAARAGKSAVAASKRKVALPRTTIGAVYNQSTGDVSFDEAVKDVVLGVCGIYGDVVADDDGALEILGDEPDGRLEIVGNSGPDWFEIVGASAGAAALATRAAQVRAQLLNARQRAASAPQKVAKANASINRHAQTVAAYVKKAQNAQSRGTAALAQAKTAKAAIDSTVARLKKLGIKTTVMGADAASDKIAYERMPGDAIPFPAGKAIDNGAIGSWLMYYGSGGRLGYGWTGHTWAFVGPAGTVQLSGTPTAAVSRASTQGLVPVPGNTFAQGGLNLAGGTFGPIIGDPNNPDYAGAHYSPLDDKLWWLNDGSAPLYATKERDEAIALLAQQEADAQAAAEAAAMAEADQRQAAADAQAAELQAKYDAEDAEFARRAEQQAAELALQDEKLQAELAAQQARDDAEYGRQQQQIDLRAQQAALDYAIAHPDEVDQPSSDGGGMPPAPDRAEDPFEEDSRGRGGDDSELEQAAMDDMPADPFGE